MVEAVDRALVAYQSAQIDRQTRSHAVAWQRCGYQLLEILLRTVAQQSFARDAYHTHADALGSEQLGALDQRGDLGAGGYKHGFGVGRVDHDIASEGSLHGLLATAAAAHGGQ